MITINETRAAQMELDFAIDAERQARQEWQRAIDSNLHALQDYVSPAQLIVWQPGERKRGPQSGHGRTFDVQITTSTSCTCQRFKLLERCQHVAFVRKLQAVDALPGPETPVAAREVH